jgi:hypothetical protein
MGSDSQQPICRKPVLEILKTSVKSGSLQSAYCRAFVEAMRNRRTSRRHLDLWKLYDEHSKKRASNSLTRTAEGRACALV